jgi:alkylation response protein AidB-like acyl-CoA dehydrogenase
MLVNEADEMMQMLVDSAASFLADKHERKRLRIGNLAPRSAVDTAVWQAIIDLGWLGLRVPESLDGAGLDFGYTAGLCETFGNALLPEPFIAYAVMPAGFLARCPDGDAKTRAVADFLSGHIRFSLAWQEEPGQLAPLSLTARRDASGKLSGTKLFVPCSLPGTNYLVSVIDGATPAVLLLPSDTPGLKIEPFRLGDGSMAGTLSLDGLICKAAPLASGDAAVAALQAALDEATIAIAAQLAGLAEGALALSVDYLKTRTQFGRLIGSFQALQHRATDLYLAVELAKATWRRAARLYDTQPGTDLTQMAISAAKVTSAKAARKVTKEGVQLFGAMGFTEEADIGLYLRSALQWSAWLGGEAAHGRRYLNNLLDRRAA